MSSGTSGIIDTSSSLRQCAIAIVEEPSPCRKVEMARHAAKNWERKGMPSFRKSEPAKIPDMPGRPEMPQLLPPRDMPKRKAGTKSGLIALVHALVHIELNAIDMAFDLIARWSEAPLPRSFLDEAVQLGLDEARHFEMMNARLEELGASYGDLPAHGNLWDATKDTRQDLLARLAIVPMILEARGLDVTPSMIEQVKKAGARTTADSMEIIYREEIGHVAFGVKWFKYLCSKQKTDPVKTFHTLARKYFKGHLKPPFNQKARLQAGLEAPFYVPLATKT